MSDEPALWPGLDPDWMPERAALQRKYGEERHLHFPEHLQPLAAAINRLYFDPSHLPWLKEAAGQGSAEGPAKAHRRRAPAPDLEQTTGCREGLIDAAHIPPRDRRRGVGRVRRDRR